MKSGEPLAPEALYQRCDPDQFSFETTAELEAVESIPGQERAVEAIRFGMQMACVGFNLFVLGEPGSGRHEFVRHLLQRQGSKSRSADDWCYVNNFALPQKPRALRLPTGRGRAFRDDIARLIEETRVAIPAALECEEFTTRQQALLEEFKEQQSRSFEAVQAHARERGINIIETPTGFTFAPQRDGETIKPAEFEKMPDADKERIQADIEQVGKELRQAMQATPRRVNEMRRKTEALEREVTGSTIELLVADLAETYRDLPDVVSHLHDLEADIVVHVDLFRKAPEPNQVSVKALLEGRELDDSSDGSAALHRYGVNVLVDHDGETGAPVVTEESPGYSDLLGRVEHQARMGTLTTDFHLVRAGALHRANGGYLLLDVRQLLLQPFAWEGLKQALKSREIRIKSLGEALSLVSTVSLEPEPIPLDVKVVLLGDRLLYYLLQAYDPDFPKLFKVAADFDDRIARNPENSRDYARLVGQLARDEALKPLDRGGVARLLEACSRRAGDADKLTAQVMHAADIVREAHHRALGDGRQVIDRAAIQATLDARARRSGRIRDRLLEETRRGTQLIDTDGTACGQVNGLSVLQVGEDMFGHPCRITARVAVGSGEVIDIEREVELGGPIHSKGVLILSGYLAAHYAPDLPLSLHATLVFEQSYGGVEGDSASAAELCTLLSALSGVPLRQDLAITGSVNQFGMIQPIGGVNEKIEGFFDVCRDRGLTGRQGVLIPVQNVRHLMLREEVVTAAAEGRFSVVPMATIDDCLALLTGMPAGTRGAQGEFPEGSVNARVRERLVELAGLRRAFARNADARDAGS